MGFAQGLRAGSSTVRDAFDSYYMVKDRKAREEQEAKVKAELDKLDTPQQALVMPKAEFTAEGVPGMQGLAVAPQATGGARGLELSAMPAQQATSFDSGSIAPTPRAPSALEREAVYGNVARIKGDVAGMRASDQNRAALRVKDVFSRYMKEFDSDNEGQVDVAIRQLNTTDGVVTIGDADKKGYRELSFVDSDGRGKFTKLTRAEQAQLYAAGQMMAEYPEEAMARIAAINKDLADSLAKRNSMVTGITGANNQVNNLRNDDIRGDEQLQLQRAANADAASYRRQALAIQRKGAFRSGQIGEYVDKNGNTVLVDLGAAGRDSTGRVLIPDGLMPKTVRQQVTPQARMELISDYVGNGMSPGEAALFVDQQLGMLPGAGAGLAAPDLVQMNERAAPAATRPQPAASAQPAPYRGMTLRQAQEIANQGSRTPVDLRGLVVRDPQGGQAPLQGLEYLYR